MINLINGLWTIHRTIWFVRVIEGNPGIDKLVHRLASERLSRVWRVFLTVVLP